MSRRRKFSWGTVEFDWDGFSEVRKSPEMRELMEELLEGVAEEAEQYPPGGSSPNRKAYGWDVREMDATLNGIVFPASPHAANSNAKHNTLVKLLGKGERL